jgi:glucosamine--fructose-6-phosphate aminotransferase (isomerizing)
MCGIVGYIGKRDATGVILAGLKRLEYRGYDSAGIALYPSSSDNLTVIKRAGKIANLEAGVKKELSDKGPAFASLGIGHTRWATHGKPTEDNAHPHLSRNGKFAVVHNGIIDNYAGLKEKLISDGYSFKSETDTEVIAHLVEACYDGDLRSAVAAALSKLDGTYGICVISSLHPDTLIAARKGSPIVVGICKDETIIASDVSALVSHTNQVVFMDDGDILTASGDAFDITSLENVPVSRKPTTIDWDLGDIEKGGYPHFMLKEIFEQPTSLANTTRGRLLQKEGSAKLSGMQMDSREMAQIDRISIAACGTSLYAGMVGKNYFEEFAGIPTEIQQAAEFRDRNPIVLRDTCMLAISQSGETADTLAAVREAMRKGATVLGICNVVGSTIAREAGRGVYLHAGPEIGVASTKAFTCQVSVMAMMAIIMGRTRRLSESAGQKMVAELERLPEIVQRVLDQSDTIKDMAERYADKEDCFFLGRGYMFPAALEGALKLKEISYIHAEGYHAAELKHGPIALLGESVPVVVAVPEGTGREKTIANMQECRARQSPVLAIATEGDEEIIHHSDDIIRIPKCMEFISPIPVVVAEQLFAYHIANLRGCAIDQPRNLAKSVTVE